MANRALTICHQAGCGRTVRDANYCERHVQSNDVTAYDARRFADDPIRRRYFSRGYHKFRAVMLSYNPLCQRLIGGVVCSRAATVLHHVVDPSIREDLFLTPSNAICLCAKHHPAGVKGNPEHWVEGRDFSKTVVPKPHA